MQIQGSTIFQNAKASGSFGPEGQKQTIDADKGLKFFEDEFIAESETFRMLDNSPFDTNKVSGQLKVGMGVDMQMEGRFHGSPIGGEIQSSGRNEGLLLDYHMESKDMQVSCLGVALDLDGNLSHGALLRGDLKTDTFTLETIGDVEKLKQDETFTRLTEYFFSA
jgi:hypothetical protein